MDFGERIYELRSKNGMSQGELADKLDVSRQAVSKWENNSAVPDLDKLLKMSELFSVSLDELVKGEKTEKAESNAPEKEIVPVIIKQSLPMRKTAGLILFLMAFITAIVFFTMGGFPAMLYGLPFAVCGIICYFSEKHPGLKCLWFLYYAVQIFLTFTTTRVFAFDSLMTGELSVTAVMGLVLLVVNIFMIVFTTVRLKEEPIRNESKAKRNLAVIWCLTAVSFILQLITDYAISVLATKMSDASSVALSDMVYIFYTFEELVTISLISLVIPYTLRCKKLKKQ